MCSANKNYYSHSDENKSDLKELGEKIASIKETLLDQRECGVIRKNLEYYEFGAKNICIDPYSDRLSAELSKWALITIIKNKFLPCEVSRLNEEVETEDSANKPNSTLKGFFHFIGYSLHREESLRRRATRIHSLLEVSSGSLYCWTNVTFVSPGCYKNTISRRLPYRDVYAIAYRSQLPYHYGAIVKGLVKSFILPSRIFSRFSESQFCLEDHNR